MRAILIDPTTKTVTEIEHEGVYRAIVQTLGIRYIEMVRLGLDHHMYVDEEGLLVDSHPHGYFKFPTTQVYAGKALIFREEPDGEEAPASIPVEHVRRIVQFIDAPTDEEIEPRVDFISFDTGEAFINYMRRVQ
jgi:hypothetical protein